MEAEAAMTLGNSVGAFLAVAVVLKPSLGLPMALLFALGI